MLNSDMLVSPVTETAEGLYLTFIRSARVRFACNAVTSRCNAVASPSGVECRATEPAAEHSFREVPRRLPKAGVLVHNWVHAQWEDQRPGRNGFRVWMEPKPKTGRPLCHCGVTGKSLSASSTTNRDFRRSPSAPCGSAQSATPSRCAIGSRPRPYR